MHPGLPELQRPPQGWTVVRHGLAARLIPPGAYADHCRASMSVSPLVPVSQAMPDIETLMRQALSAEVIATGITIEAEVPAIDVQTDSGLHGKRLEFTIRHPKASQSQHRIYSMYRDDSWIYGLHYVADEQTFDFFRTLYEDVAQSIAVTA